MSSPNAVQPPLAQTGSWTWRTVATVAQPAHTIERPPPPAMTARQVISAKPKRHPLYTPQRPNASTVHHWRGYLQRLLVPNLRACPVSLSVGWVTHSTKPWLSVHPGCTSATCWRWGPLGWALPCLRLCESGGACRRGRSSPPVNVYDTATQQWIVLPMGKAQRGGLPTQNIGLTHAGPMVGAGRVWATG